MMLRWWGSSEHKNLDFLTEMIRLIGHSCSEISDVTLSSEQRANA